MGPNRFTSHVPARVTTPVEPIVNDICACRYASMLVERVIKYGVLGGLRGRF